MLAKICGIRDRHDAEAAVSSGAAVLGFLVGTTHLAEDAVTAEVANGIVATLPPFVSSVMVTHWTDPDQIAECAVKIGVSAVQVHDCVEPSVMDRLRVLLPHVKVIKAVPVTDWDTTTGLVREFQGYCDAILLDSVCPGRIGGTGVVHDWDVSREIAGSCQVPVILAGGLTPGNVGEAIKSVRPFAVDVNSGVEEDLGAKDVLKVRKFVRIAAAH